MNRSSRLSTQTCSPRATRAGKRSGGSGRTGAAGSGGWVADAVLVDRGRGAAHGKADGVVDQQEKGQPGLAGTEPGRLQRSKEGLGQGQGVGSQGVAGLEDAGHPGMGLQHLPEPVGQDLELLGPAQGGVEVDVDLGQDVVQDQVLELLFVADVVVQGAGDDPRRAARRRMVRAWTPSWAMTVQRLFDDAFTGQLRAAVLAVGGRVEP